MNVERPASSLRLIKRNPSPEHDNEQNKFFFEGHSAVSRSIVEETREIRLAGTKRRGERRQGEKQIPASVVRGASVCQLARAPRVRLIGAQRGLQIRISFARCELSFVRLTFGFESQGQRQISAA
jgi:hypothetical protein